MQSDHGKNIKNKDKYSFVKFARSWEYTLKDEYICTHTRADPGF